MRATAPSPTPLTLTATEVAGILHVTPTALARWRAEGRGPRWARTGDRKGRVIYRSADVDAWLDDRAQGGETR